LINVRFARSLRYRGTPASPGLADRRTSAHPKRASGMACQRAFGRSFRRLRGALLREARAAPTTLASGSVWLWPAAPRGLLSARWFPPGASCAAKWASI